MAYSFVGKKELIPSSDQLPERTEIIGADSVLLWCQKHKKEVGIDGTIPATWIIDKEQKLWIADRYTEHVVCARGGDVLSAGEVFFAVHKNQPEIKRITNQSTGYCPEVETWEIVSKVLFGLSMPFPAGFEPAFEFRRCPTCQTIAIVKDFDFTCAQCGAELPEEWNLGNRTR